MLKLYEVN